MARFSRTGWMSRIAGMSNRRCSPRPPDSSLWLAQTAEATDGLAAHSLPDLAARPLVPIPPDSAAGEVHEASAATTVARDEDVRRHWLRSRRRP